MAIVKKYTTNDFVKKYNSAKSDQTREALIKSVMNVEYIPYERKITICEKIVENTYYIKDLNETKKLHVNSPAQYMLRCLWLVKEYTNIEVNMRDSLEEFNLLNKNRLFDVIISCIPEGELKEFSMLLDMTANDTMTNEYESHAFISSQVERFSHLFVVTMQPLIERLNKIIENLDEKTIDELSGKLNLFNKINEIKEKFKIVK